MRRKGKKKKKAGMGAEEIPNPGCSISPVAGLSKVLELPKACEGESFYREAVATLKVSFSVPMQISYHSQSILPGPCGNGSEGFRGLWQS